MIGTLTDDTLLARAFRSTCCSAWSFRANPEQLSAVTANHDGAIAI